MPHRTAAPGRLAREGAARGAGPAVALAFFAWACSDSGTRPPGPASATTAAGGGGAADGCVAAADLPAPAWYPPGLPAPGSPDFRGTGAPSPPPAHANRAPGVAYVGRETCRTCHWDIYQTYVKTGMGRAFYPVGPENAVEDFARENRVDLDSGLSYRMVSRDGRLFQQQFLRDRDGREIALDEREMLYAIGSGNHSRSYLTVEDGKLFQMPICWYPEAGIWDLCPGYEHQNDHFTRQVTQPCVFCHNGRMEPLPGAAPNDFKQPFVEGIGCERCHGPGALHVEKWSSGESEPTGDLDPTIVNPRRLTADRRIHVCFQCHLGDSMATTLVPRTGADTQSWRPGGLITDALIHFRFAEPSPTRFGLSAQADRLFLSRCFQESDGRLECLTCHNPHVTVYRDDRPDDFFTARCRTCHERDASCTATRIARLATTPPDDCVACHMRRAEPDDHPHTTFTDHWIRRDIDVEPRERERFDLVPMLPEIVAGLPAAERLHYLGKAYLSKSLRTDGDERSWMRAQAEQRLSRAIACGQDTADVWFDLGVNRKYARRLEEAIEAFRAALDRRPDHRDAAFALGQVYMEAERPEDAARTFRALLDRVPDDGPAMAELGLVELALGRPLEALALYDRALLIEPLKPSLHANRGMSLAGAGRLQEALDALDRATRLDPDQGAYWRFYARLLEGAGRSEEAQRARAAAMAAAATEIRSPSPSARR